MRVTAGTARGRAIAGAATLVYVLVCFVRATTSVDYGPIDSTWLHALHLAFVERLAFGRELIVVFGPWGFLLGGHHPATASLSIATWTVLAVVFWWAAWKAALHLSEHPLAAGCWLIAFTAAASIPDAHYVDGRMTAWVTVLLLLHFFVEDTPLSARQLAVAASIGLLSLTKFTVFVLAAIVVVPVSIDTLWRHRRFPWIAVVWAGSVLLFWLAAGQSAGALPDYLLHSWRLSQQYSDAMSLELPGGGPFVGAFVALAAAVVASFGAAGWALHGPAGLLAMVAAGGLAAVAFRNGYVRHDWHDIGAAMALLVLALGGLAAAWPVCRRRDRRLAAIALALPIASLALCWATLGRGGAGHGLVRELASTFGSRAISAARLLTGGGTSREQSEQRFAAVRGQYPLPPMEGDVDAYPWNQLAIFAHGLPYRPRPVPQSYATVTPELAELNAAHLRGGTAAQNVVFEIAPTDGRFPTMDDGRSLPELLTRYDVAASDGERVLLKRSPAPRAYEIAPLREETIAFDQQLRVPTTRHALWAEIDVEKTALGRLASAAYKIPELLLTVALQDGGQRQFRLVTGMARSGFLLSPLISDTTAFASLASPEGRLGLAPLRVKWLALSVAGTTGPSPYYTPTIRLRLSRLVLDDRDE